MAYIGEKKIMQIIDLAAGAETANQRCMSNQMYGFICGLNAALDILNAENIEAATKKAAAIRKQWAEKTKTSQRHWRVGETTPDKDWIVK